MEPKDTHALLYRRILWQCRRGLLELDLLLKAFCDQYGETLTVQECFFFHGVLQKKDEELIEIFMGSTTLEELDIPDPFGLLERMRAICFIVPV